MKKLLDWPPIWLLGMMAVVYLIAHLWPGVTVAFAARGWAGGALIVAGLLISALAAWEMTRAHTTVVPRKDPSALVTSGVFRFSRNPIYLSDELMLLGWIVLWGAVLALPLLVIFPWIITKRFIEGEEARMRAHFADQFESWAKQTRRWL